MAELRNALPNMDIVMTGFGRDNQRVAEEVRDLLLQLRSSRVGTVMLAAVAWTGNRRITVVPWRECERNAEAIWETAEGEQHARALDEPGPVGTGGGTEALLRYTPSWFPRRSRRRQGIAGGLVQDAALLHELVHALRITRGVVRVERMGEGYDLHDEFMAILIENMYLSEQGRPLRGDHRGDRILVLRDAAAVTAWCLEHGRFVAQFAGDLPDVAMNYLLFPPGRPAFNPFHEVQGLPGPAGLYQRRH